MASEVVDHGAKSGVVSVVVTCQRVVELRGTIAESGAGWRFLSWLVREWWSRMKSVAVNGVR